MVANSETFPRGLVQGRRPALLTLRQLREILGVVRHRTVVSVMASRWVGPRVVIRNSSRGSRSSQSSDRRWFACRTAEHEPMSRRADGTSSGASLRQRPDQVQVGIDARCRSSGAVADLIQCRALLDRSAEARRSHSPQNCRLSTPGASSPSRGAAPAQHESTVGS